MIPGLLHLHLGCAFQCLSQWNEFLMRVLSKTNFNFWVALLSNIKKEYENCTHSIATDGKADIQDASAMGLEAYNCSKISSPL